MASQLLLQIWMNFPIQFINENKKKSATDLQISIGCIFASSQPISIIFGFLKSYDFILSICRVFKKVPEIWFTIHIFRKWQSCHPSKLNLIFSKVMCPAPCGDILNRVNARHTFFAPAFAAPTRALPLWQLAGCRPHGLTGFLLNREVTVFWERPKRKTLKQNLRGVQILYFNSK